MRAVVDIGSNSVKFLAGEILRGVPRITGQGSKVTRLAEQLGQNGGYLIPQALERTEMALKGFATQIQGIPVEAVATAAARKAKNVIELSQVVERSLSCPLKVISGEEEAEWSRLGSSIAARSAFPDLNDFIFIDMGGASTEISTSQKLSLQHSFQAGAVSIMEKVDLAKMPITDSLWTDAKTKIADFFPEEFLDPMVNWARTKPAAQLIAVGGTLLIAAKIARAMTSGRFDYGIEISAAELNELNEKLRRLDQAERLALPGMEIGREDLVCAGLLALSHLMNKFGQSKIFITLWGLRHGLLFGSK